MRFIVHYNNQIFICQKDSKTINQVLVQLFPFRDYINQLILLYFTTMLQLASIQIAHSKTMEPLFLDFWPSGQQFWTVNQQTPGRSLKQKSTTASYCPSALILSPFPWFLRVRRCPQACSPCLCLILPLKIYIYHEPRIFGNKMTKACSCQSSGMEQSILPYWVEWYKRVLVTLLSSIRWS